MISDASVLVSCDEDGCDNETEFYLEPLAPRGSWDDRYLRRSLERDGWRFVDDEHLRCPEHFTQPSETSR